MGLALSAAWPSSWRRSRCGRFGPATNRPRCRRATPSAPTAPADQPTAETGAAGAPTADDTVIQPEPDTAPASGEPSAPAETAAEPATPAQSADTGPSEAGAASSVPAAVPTAVDQADPIVAQSLPDASAAAQVANEDAMPATARTGALPEDGTLLHDLTPLAPAEPVPYGSLVRFDAQGFVIATPEGVITPGGFRLVAGKPPLRPAERPEAVAAAAAATPAAATPGPSDAVAPAAAPGATSGSEPAPVWADPKLRGKRPQPRPADLAVPADQGAAARHGAVRHRRADGRRRAAAEGPPRGNRHRGSHAG